MATSEDTNKKLELLYTLFCDDVRLEVGNKLSFMGVFQNIMVQQLPVSLIKFAVVTESNCRRSRAGQIPLRPSVEGPKNIPPLSSFKPMTLDYGKAADRVEDVTRRLQSILGL